MKKKDKEFIIMIGLAVGLCMFLWLFVSPAPYNSAKAEVFISEICSKKDVCAHDHYGNYGADYVELYNDTDEEIDITGYSLSDSKKNLKKYVFDETLIKPNSGIIVWHSENSDTYSEYLIAEHDKSDIYGLSFGIKAGENIYFCNSDGKLIQRIKIPETPNGMVILRPSNSDEYVIGRPSPYRLEDKNLSIIDEPETIISPEFTIRGGGGMKIRWS